MEKAYFDVTLSKERKSIEENDNVELYSLNGSFGRDDVLWRFNLYCVGASFKAYGSIEKKRKNDKLPFSTEEATSAVFGNFLGVKSLTWCTEPQERFAFFRSEYIAFTLRTSINVRERLMDYQKWKKQNHNDVNNGKFWVETGSIRDQNRVSNVHGLLTLEYENNLDLEDCAHMLGRVFPKELITWMTYCTNRVAYHRKLIFEYPQQSDTDSSSENED